MKKYLRFPSLLILSITGLLLPNFAQAERVSHLGCYAEWSGDVLTIGNELVERRWKIEPGGLLRSISFYDKVADKEWLRGPSRQPVPFPDVPPADEPRAFQFTVVKEKSSPVEADSLILHAEAVGQEQTFHYRFQVFPKSGGISMTFSDNQPEEIVAATEEAAESGLPTGLEDNPDSSSRMDKFQSALDDLKLSPAHLRYIKVEFLDQTDHHDELVFEREWLTRVDVFDVRCNVFLIEDNLTKNGLIFLKQAPLPHARPIQSAWDAKVFGRARRVAFSGHGYPWTIIPYQGGRTGRIVALQRYQRCLREYEPERDGMLLSNTWGDRSRDARVSEEFLMKEIEAGARFGVDVVQVDDGWQKGMSGNSAFGRGAWEDFRSANPDFWEPHPERFPNGLKPLVEAAAEKGMQFGLWFGPSAENEMASWEADADLLIDYYKDDGIKYVKVDAIRMETKLAEQNLEKMYQKVLRASDGELVFDPDATAGERPTYFGSIQAGPVFVENRYTDWGKYWPHRTLRNLWSLAQYIDPVRMRMEFLNNTRNTEKYGDDPLAPARYAPDTLFATVMFSSPLAWFEVSSLPESYFEQAAPLVHTWKQEREAIFSGDIIPIGERPDGVVWTGFASVAKDRKSAHLVVFRELNDAAEWNTTIPLLETDQAEVSILGGEGEAEFRNGELEVEIGEKLQYLFLKIEAE
ncbi:MAG TPA: alpha-galactosidase [Opitutales bacterium]|nr:alpha-galactosidase [Opitutales bacterium]